ncbi:hypothetical protein EV715DRAFT_290964 [Schizophyllum commune]
MSGSGDADWAHSARLTVFTLPQPEVANGTSITFDVGPTYDDRSAHVYYPQHIADGETPTFYTHRTTDTGDDLRTHTIQDEEPAKIFTTDRTINYHALQACSLGPNSMAICDDGLVFTDFFRWSGTEVQFIWPRRDYGTQLQGTLRLEYSSAHDGDVRAFDPTTGRLNQHNHPSEITVYDIEPEAPSPAFMPIACTRNLGGITYPRSSQGGLCDTRLVVTSGSSIMLWDFERDTRVIWPYQEEDEWPHLHIFGERVAISTVRAFQDAQISIFVPPPAEGILTRCRLTPIYDLMVGSDVAICHPMHLAADLSFTFHLLRKGLTGSLSTYVLHKDEMTWRGVAPYGCRRLILIAGGSYLLLESPAVGIQLLRLGGAGPEFVDVIPKRRHGVGGDVVPLPNLMDYCIVRDGRVLRLATSTLNPTPDIAFEVNIYDIEPEAPGATFKVVARTHDLGGIRNPHSSRWSLCDTRLAVCDLGYALLWDFLQDTRTLWSHRPTRIQHGEMRLHVFGDHVAIMSWSNHASDTRLAIYAPPAAHAPNTFCDLEPIHELTVPPGVQIHHPEHTAADGSFTFHIHRTFAVDDNLRTHTLREGPTATLTADRSFGKDVWRAYRPGLNAMVHCDGGQVSTEALREGGRQVQFVCPRPELNSELLGTVTLEYLSSRATDRCAFDPASGRMCAVKDDGSLVVIDYL